MSGIQAVPPGVARSAPRRPALRRRVVIPVVIVAVLAFVVAALAVYVGSLGATYDSMRKTVPSSDVFPAQSTRPAAVPSTAAAAKAQNVLLLGTDSDEPAPKSVAGLKGLQSDTVLLLHVPADGKHVYAISVPRSALVPVAGHGTASINTALATGGLPLTVETVEGLFGVRVDHVAVVSMAGFRSVTTALGGVTVDNPAAFDRDGYSFAQGRVTLSGAEANSYVRAGDSSPAADAQQLKNQQAFLAGLLRKILSAGTFLNPITLHDTVAAIAPYLLVDQGLDAGYIANLTLELRALHPSDIEYLTVPAATTSASGTSLDPEALAALSTDLKNDTVGAYTP